MYNRQFKEGDFIISNWANSIYIVHLVNNANFCNLECIGSTVNGQYIIKDKSIWYRELLTDAYRYVFISEEQVNKIKKLMVFK